jgi:hypothetical protein
VTSGGKNFAAVMLPKRRAGARTFRTVTAGSTRRTIRPRPAEDATAAAGLAAKGLAGAVRLYEQALSGGGGPQPGVRDGLACSIFRWEEGRGLFAPREAMDQDPNLPSLIRIWAPSTQRAKYKELLVVCKARFRSTRSGDGHAFLGRPRQARGSGSSPTIRRNRLLS